MSTKPYDFQQQLAIGERGEARLDEFFAARYVVSPVCMDEQRRGIDRHFVNRETEKAFTVEYKTDSTARRTHNAFIETVSVDAKGKSGWAYTSQADWLVYYVPGDEVAYAIRFDVLRQRVAAWATKYPLKRAPNKGYDTFGIAVPLHELERCASQVYSL